MNHTQDRANNANESTDQEDNGRYGRAPTHGLGERLYRLGKIQDRDCPECDDGELHAAGNSTLVCGACGRHFSEGSA